MINRTNFRVNLDMNLKQLRLPEFLSNYERISREGIDSNISCEQFLYALTELEMTKRTENRVTTLLKNAKFPIKKTLNDFDFLEVPSIKKQVMIELSKGNFLLDAKNIIFYGTPGAGKTHLAIAIGRELCLKKYRVRFITACELVQDLLNAKNNLTLSRLFKRLNRFDLLIIDEMGYIPFKREETDLLFQLVSERYERKSILMTTNLVFSEWDKIFKDTTTTTAVVDRLVHHSHIFDLCVDSYRGKQAKNNYRQ